MALAHFEAFPSSMMTDDKGDLILPVVQERRIHVGFHNSKTFIDKLVLANVVPDFDEQGHGTDLVYHGQLELPSYIPGEWGMALIFMIEYKVQLAVRAPIEKKTGLSALVETFSKAPKEPNEKQFIEKLICCGWSSWGICDAFVDRYLEVPVDTSASQNPFNSLIYTPKINCDSTKPDQVKSNQELTLLFRFHDESYPPLSSVRGMV